MKALLALEDGRTFDCRSFTGPGETGGEVVFNTSMTGYQEVLTDPSYQGQLVTMTYPLVGNYGTNPEDIESDRIQVAGFLIREYQALPSNFRSTAPLAAYLKEQGILGIHQLDTRALTRHIRKTGAMRGCISTIKLDPDALVQKARQMPTMAGQDLVRAVTCHRPYFWKEGKPTACDTDIRTMGRPVPTSKDRPFFVVAFDFGIKYNILRNLSKAGCEILVVPADTPAETVMALDPDGIFLSNGPGDPQPVTYAVDTIKALIGRKPVFGICLGHQLLGLALGATTYKLKFGHRGANQPVKNLLTGRIEITSQNHGFAVDISSLNPDDIQITHTNLNDGTLEGFRHRHLPVMAVQYHPEASPGPHDADYLFGDFRRMMEGN